MNTVVVSFGSNINPIENIQKAKDHLGSFCVIMKETPLTQTKPIGILDQPDFINGAWLIRTALDQTTLTRKLKNIEDALGRDRSAPKFGPRTIDLDISVWNDRITDPNAYDRDFLATELKELLPGLKLERTL